MKQLTGNILFAQRFNSFESDFKLAPGAYTNKKELKSAAVKAKEVLGKLD